MNREIILVTGASGAIGSEIARAVARPDRVVLVHYRSRREAAEFVVDAVRDLGGTAAALGADLTEADQVGALFAEIDRDWGGLDVLVHNAAPVLALRSILKASWSDFQEQFEVQVKGGLLCSQAAVQRMKARRRGHIVCLLSAFLHGAPGAGFASYITAKHALAGLMRCLGAEAIRFGVRVNFVSPSLNRTELVSGLPEKLFEIAAEGNPLGRLCTPADVAGVVRFLLSEEASFLHLADLPVTGGATD